MNKAGGSDGIPVEVFQILKMMLFKFCSQYASKFGKLCSGHRTGKGQFSFQCQRMFRLSHKCTHLTRQQSNAQKSSNEASTVCELRIYKCTSWVQKRQRTRDQTASIHWIIKKPKEFQKNIYFCFTDYAKAFDCVDHNKLENFSRDGITRQPNLPTEKSVCKSREATVRNRHGTMDWF